MKHRVATSRLYYSNHLVASSEQRDLQAPVGKMGRQHNTNAMTKTYVSGNSFILLVAMP